MIIRETLLFDKGLEADESLRVATSDGMQQQELIASDKLLSRSFDVHGGSSTRMIPKSPCACCIHNKFRHRFVVASVLLLCEAHETFHTFHC